MLFLNLITQEWKKGIRKQGFYKNLAVNIMLGIVALYMAAVFLFLGFKLDDILEEVNGKLNPTELINGAMLYIMIGGLSLRFFMQQLNTFNLPPYQTLPVKRSVIINFLIIKPLAGIINYFFLLVIVPFVIQSTAHYYTAGIAFRLVLAFLFVVWTNSLLAAYLKRRFGSGFFSFLGVILILAGISSLEYFKIFSLFDFSKQLFDFIVLNRLGLTIPIATMVIAFLMNKWFFNRNYYPENFNRNVNRFNKVRTANLSFLDRFGEIGDLISIELKLIFRHKRSKNMIFMSAIFLLYGFLFYPKQNIQQQDGLIFFVALFLTGLLMFIYGQWVISWDSNHFDSLMTRNIPIKTYMEANYYLLVAFSVICFILTTPYFLFGRTIILMHIAAFIFNIGINVFLLLFFSTYNTKRIDLSRSSAMNYQGTTYKNFLVMIPLLLLPILIMNILSGLFSVTIALGVLSLLGIAGVLFRKKLIELCVNQFNQRKYKIAKGFRENE